MCLNFFDFEAPRGHKVVYGTFLPDIMMKCLQNNRFYIFSDLSAEIHKRIRYD